MWAAAPQVCSSQAGSSPRRAASSRRNSRTSRCPLAAASEKKKNFGETPGLLKDPLQDVDVAVLRGLHGNGLPPRWLAVFCEGFVALAVILSLIVDLR